MHVCYRRDPAIQKIARLPVVEYLRRETGLDCLVAFHWQDEREDPHPTVPGLTKVVPVTRWVIAMFDGEFLLDIGEFESDDDGRPIVNRDVVEAIIVRMRTLISKHEAKRRVREHSRAVKRQINDMAERHLETDKKVYHDVKQRHSEKRADEWAHKAAPHLIDGGPWSHKKET